MIVNVDGSAIVNAQAPIFGAHWDIHRPEISGLVLLAALGSPRLVLTGSGRAVSVRRFTCDVAKAAGL